MKKEILIVVFIVLAIVIAHVVSQTYIKNFFESVSKDLDKIEEKIFSDNFDIKDLEKDIEDIQTKWNSKHDGMACFIEHDLLDSIEMQFVLISSNIKVENYDKSMEEAEKCKFLLKSIKDKDSLSAINIL